MPPVGRAFTFVKSLGQKKEVAQDQKAKPVLWVVVVVLNQNNGDDKVKLYSCKDGEKLMGRVLVLGVEISSSALSCLWPPAVTVIFSCYMLHSIYRLPCIYVTVSL